MVAFHRSASQKYAEYPRVFDAPRFFFQVSSSSHLEMLIP